MASVWVNGLGVAAAICSMTSFTPQIVKIIRKRDASSVSLRMYVATVVGFSLWIAYGLVIASWPVAISNTVNLALSGAILLLRWRLGDASTPATERS
jgi:MtN3 and saliva related transmembrane protein